MTSGYDFHNAHIPILTIVEQLNAGGSGPPGPPRRPLGPRLRNVLETFDRSQEYEVLREWAVTRLRAHATGIALIRGRYCDDVENLANRLGDVEHRELADNLSLEAGGPTILCHRWPSSNRPLAAAVEEWPWPKGVVPEQKRCDDLVAAALEERRLCIVRLKVSETDAPSAAGVASPFRRWFAQRQGWPGDAWLRALAGLCAGYTGEDRAGRLLILCAVDRPNRAAAVLPGLPDDVFHVPVDRHVSRTAVEAWKKYAAKVFGRDNAAELCDLLCQRLFSGSEDEVPFERAKAYLREILEVYQFIEDNEGA
jgi:hypothetical protein